MKSKGYERGTAMWPGGRVRHDTGVGFVGVE